MLLLSEYLSQMVPTTIPLPFRTMEISQQEPLKQECILMRPLTPLLLVFQLEPIKINLLVSMLSMLTITPELFLVIKYPVFGIPGENLISLSLVILFTACSQELQVLQTVLSISLRSTVQI